MSPITWLAALLRRLSGRRPTDRDLDDELKQYFDAVVEQKVAAGLTLNDAIRSARLEVGSRASIRDGVRDTSPGTYIEGVWRDVLHAARLLHRNPGFTAAAVVPMAIGIGAAVTVYSAVYGVLLRPLPVHDEGTLAVGYERRTAGGDNSLAYPRYLAWRDSGAVADLAATTEFNFALSVDGVTEQSRGAGVSGNFFTVLGVRPLRGRTLSPSDAAVSAPVAVISSSLWKRRFNSSEQALGQTISVRNKPFTIVGIAPERFERWRGEAYIWMPIETIYEPSVLGSIGYIVATPIARLKSGATLRQSEEHLAAVDTRFMESIGALKRYRTNGTRVGLVALHDDVVPAQLEKTLVVLLAAVALTALVVCAHVANLALARGLRRSSEIALRLALGAHRRRIVRQLAIESLVLGLPGGLGGWAIAWAGASLLVAFGPPGIAGNETIRVDVPVASFAVGLTIAVTLASALVPALRLSRMSLGSIDQDRIAPRQMSGALLVLELAFAVMVMVGAALLVKSFDRLANVDLGFRSANIISVRYDLAETIRDAGTESDRRASLAQTQRHLLASVARVPGVAAATIGASFRPAGPGRTSIWLEDGRRFMNGEPDQREFAPRGHRVGPGFFRIHGVAVIQGREFSDKDDESAPKVAIISRRTAQLLWPGQEALGRRVNFRGMSPVNGQLVFTEPWAEIVGVVADMRYGSADSPILPEIYTSALQEPSSGQYLLLKTSGDPSAVMGELREAIQSVDARIPVYLPRTLDDLVAESTAITRYNAALLSLCAAITSLLGCFGVYSLLAYAVASRRRELGIRIALGEEPGRLVGGVVKQAGWLIALGIGSGLLFATFATGILSSLLFEVSPRDPLVFAGAAGAVALLGLAAAWLPAKSASRLDPVRALKVD